MTHLARAPHKILPGGPGREVNPRVLERISRETRLSGGVPESELAKAERVAEIGGLFPYYGLVPKGLLPNLEFRRRVLAFARESKENKIALRRMCARDFLFYVNVFCFGYDPRLSGSTPERPFITYPYQDRAARSMLLALGSEDILIEKTRDMGATYLVLLLFDWVWRFQPMRSLLLVSRKEALVDGKGYDPLFAKLDLIRSRQPAWLIPKLERTYMNQTNLETGSVINGEATVEDIGRGGRRFAIFLDEFAAFKDQEEVLYAAHYNSNCIFMASTPKGVANLFHDLRQSGKVQVLTMHWTLHPEKAEGLWYDDAGNPHSPWYDRQCERAVHPMEIAQELDINYLGSDSQFFEGSKMRELHEQTVRPPVVRGELVYDEAEAKPERFEEFEEGRLKLWIPIGASAPNPPDDRTYVVAVDVSAGTGASNSAVSVVDRVSGQKVAEYENPHIMPHELAVFAVALARWFNHALLIWDKTGPGRVFGSVVTGRGDDYTGVVSSGIGYGNVFTQRLPWSKTKTETPGFMITHKNKTPLIAAYRRALFERRFINPSAKALRECEQYVYLPQESVAHVKSTRSKDPSGARANHADLVTADALANHVLEVQPNPEEQKTAVVPVLSVAWLRRNREKRAKSARYRY